LNFWTSQYLVMLPISLTARPQPGTLAGGINEIIERIDVSNFDVHCVILQSNTGSYNDRHLYFIDARSL
jgi:hypothetical protein